MGCSRASVSTRHSSVEARSVRDRRNDNREFTVYRPTESCIVTESVVEREDMRITSFSGQSEDG